MFKVQWWDHIGGDVGDVLQTDSFPTEREAREVFNLLVNGEDVVRLLDTDGTLIVESRFPVLQVA